MIVFTSLNEQSLLFFKTLAQTYVRHFSCAQPSSKKLQNSLLKELNKEISTHLSCYILERQLKGKSIKQGRKNLHEL